MAEAKREFKKVLKSRDVVLFTVCAILLVDYLAASASLGAQAISWWVIVAIFFVIPYGLIIAELGTAYPSQGGLYVWVLKAFGRRWAARTTWFYWVNVALWMPAVYLEFAGMFSQLFWPDLGLWEKILMAIGMTWVTVWIGCQTLDIGKWIPNIGALVKVIIILLVGIGGIWYASKHGVANEFSWKTIRPSWGAGLAFLPVIIYNVLGFELICGAGSEINNPVKSIPRAIFISTFVVIGLYLFATIGILLALPVKDIGLIQGLIDTLRRLYGGGSWGEGFVTFIGVGIILTFLANMVTWTLGANRSAAEAARAKELPAIFGKLHPKHNTPVGAFILTGLVSTGVVCLYGLMATSAVSLFWTIFAFASVILLFPYLLVFPALLRLRSKDPDRPRPFRVPGGRVGAWLVVLCSLFFIVQGIVLFIFPPDKPLKLDYTGSILGGIILTIVVGELLVRRAIKGSKD